MELSPLLKHFVDTPFKVAESQFQEGKEVVPQITLLAEDEEGMTIVPIIATIDILGKKDTARGLVKLAFEGVLKQRPNLKLLAITLMADTWIETVSMTELEKRRKEGKMTPPSQVPGSIEAIIVQLRLEKEDSLFQWSYVRSGDDVVFSGKPEKNLQTNSVIKGLWPL